MAQSGRTKRRIIGMLMHRIGEARLDEVDDGRDPRGRRWPLATLLTGALLGLVAGSRSLKQVEQLTAELTAAVGSKLGIRRRIPDTTLRDALDHPWIEQNPRATAVVMVLRRIAYTLLALWRGVSLRSDEQRTRPWRELMHEIFLVVVTASVEQLRDLRRHRLAPAPA